MERNMEKLIFQGDKQDVGFFVCKQSTLLNKLQVISTLTPFGTSWWCMTKMLRNTYSETD